MKKRPFSTTNRRLPRYSRVRDAVLSLRRCGPAGTSVSRRSRGRTDIQSAGVESRAHPRIHLLPRRRVQVHVEPLDPPCDACSASESFTYRNAQERCLLTNRLILKHRGTRGMRIAEKRLGAVVAWEQPRIASPTDTKLRRGA